MVAFIADGKLLSAIMALLITLACAREMPPPGARPDEVPPSIVRIRPAPDSTVVDFDGALEIRFSEPVRIPNGLARQMFVTPMEVYEAETGFSDLRLRPEDGWRDSVMYCFTIPTDGINDLLRNGMEIPVEFCFSTGAEIPETMVEGEVIDALTAQPLEEARVIFWAGPDSIPYGAITDSIGRFAARGLPPGEYEAFGFVDRNRNMIPDRALESHDSAFVSASPDSLTELRFVVVAPDTTPPLLARALVVGSETVQLEFDDYLLNPQPEEPGLAIRDSATNEMLEIVASLMGSADEVTFPADSAALADSVAAADSAAVEDSAAVADTAEVEAPSPDSVAGAASDSIAEEDPVLPSRFITVRLGAALDSGTYRVAVTGVVNVRGLAGGGDTSFVAEPEPPAADSVAVADSAAAEGDSVAVEQDSVPSAPDTLDLPGVPPDTLGAPPDTAAAPPDTVAAPPDTVGAPPDTAGAPPDTVRRRA
ncbi:Ig-like domain-containing protein [Candidatus Palauibacter polyketidifaciens]|uniref:Ig-like domain-containing protein n=1 Tax=Candidatus Palauibacter polyketidifaciens TaxID=3056740 RepID=UPI0023A2FE38|nr:Ig-like domain-containing protein [Candidatus Palauibacter polyketidifaciens]MDE2719614.1 Ig-like domain-containing protein [Candidatus Palauibacter polyketidifaciens]